jgi:hypothetical protein
MPSKSAKRRPASGRKQIEPQNRECPCCKRTGAIAAVIVYGDGSPTGEVECECGFIFIPAEGERE